MLADNIKGLKSVFRKLFMISIPFMFSICLIAYLFIITSVDNSISSNVIFNYIEWLPLGLKGLMISGLFAIMMSTADSYMNESTSIIISNDLIKFYFPKIGVKKLLFIMRGIIIVNIIMFCAYYHLSGTIISINVNIKKFWNLHYSCAISSFFIRI